MNRDQSRKRTEHTHHCNDCELDLALLFDEREDTSASIVCGHCGGTNTEEVNG